MLKTHLRESSIPRNDIKAGKMDIYIGYLWIIKATTCVAISKFCQTHTLLITGADVGELAPEFLRLPSAPLPGF